MRRFEEKLAKIKLLWGEKWKMRRTEEFWGGLGTLRKKSFFNVTSNINQSKVKNLYPGTLSMLTFILAWMLAPRCTSSFTTFKWLHWHATNRGVPPSFDGRSISALLLRSSCTTLRWPPCAAKNSAVVPVCKM